MMKNFDTDFYILNFHKLRKEGYAVYQTDSVNLVFTLRGCCMADVFDLDFSAHVAYIDFDIKRSVMLGYAFGPPVIGLPFSNQFRKAYEKLVRLSGALRLRHDVGLFINRAYRNKGARRLWNLDVILMAIALETAFEEGVEMFTIKPTGNRTRYYRSKFYAQIPPTTGSDIILEINLSRVRKKLKRIELGEIEGKTHFFRVKGLPDERG